MAELDVGKLSLTIEADGRAAIFEINRVQEAVEGATTEAQRAYQSAADDLADVFTPVAESAEDAGKAGEDAAKKIENSAQKAGDSVQQAAQKSTKSLKEVVDQANRVGKTLSAVVTLPLIAAGAAAVNGASDLEETISKTDVVFDELSDTVMEWSETSVQAMGLAQGTALEMAGTFGDMATGMGIARAQAAGMSMDLTQLAADMASFKNIGIDQVRQALTGVFTGETESLKSLGIVMTQTNLQAYALAQGIQKNVSEMSQAEQVQLRYRYVLAQTANAQGDFARTGNSYANQSRKLTQTIKQTGESFGKQLLPLITGVTEKLQEGAQWLAELDDGTKNIILSAGTAALALGPLIMAGSKLLSVISGIRAAMAAFSINPIILAAGLAATAIGVGVYGALQNANREIDTTSEKYKRLKAIVSGNPLEVKTDIEEIDGETVSIILDADGTKALETARGILNELDSEEYTGTLTIDGDPEKAQQALDNLESAVNALLSGTGSVAELQAAVDACEELVISPSVDETTRAEVQGKLDELRTTLDGISEANVVFSVKQAADSDPQAWDNFVSKIDELGWETKEYTAIGKFTVDQAAVDEIEEYKILLAEALNATENYDEKVNNLNRALEQQLAAQVDAVNAQSAEQIDYLTRLYNSDILSWDDYITQIGEVNAGAQEHIDALERQYEIRKKLNEQYDNGIKADDAEVTGKAYVAMSGGETINEEDYQSAVATLTEAKNAGKDMTQYANEAMIVNQQLASQAVVNYDAMIAAQKTYNQAMEEANSTESERVTASQQVLDNAELMQSAMEEYSTALDLYNGDAEAALDYAADALSGNAEEYDSIRQQLYDTLTNNGADELTENLDLSEIYQSLKTMQEEAQANIDQAMQDAETSRATAAENFATTMSGLTGDFTASETQMLMEMTASTGAAMDETNAEMVAASASMIENMASALEGGGAEVADQVSEIISNVGDEAGNAKSQGSDVGASITSGITSGLNRGTGALYSTVRNIVNKAIQVARQASDSHSPSRKSEKLVGLPIVQGIGKGVEKGTPEVLKIMRESTNRIISSGTRVVDTGNYTVPMTRTYSAGIDYEQMGEALTDAVGQMNMVFRVSDTELAKATRESNARQQATRQHEINMGRGRIQ